MSSQVPMPAAVAGATAIVGAKLAGFELVLSVFLGVAVVVTGTVVKGFLKVDVPEPVFKKKKPTKAEKKAAKAAAAAAEESDEEPKVSEKKLKKRAKEQAKKEAKKAAAKEAQKAQAAEAKQKAAEEAEAAAAAAAAAAGGDKKKKKKKKKKAATAEKSEAVAEPAAEKKPEPVDDGNWSEVPVTRKAKAKPVVEEDTTDTKKEKVAPEATLEFECEVKFYPRILGTGGSNLRAIQEATGTEIDIPKKGGVRSEIIISGSKTGVLEAKKNLTQLVEKGYCAILNAGVTDSSVEVPAKSQGVVIGRGGENIKMISAQTGAKINMPDRDSGSNIVTVTGDSEACAQAIKAIKQLIEKGFSDITHANHTMASVTVHRDSLGTLLGTRGATIRKLQEETSCKINIPKTTDEFINVSIVGEADNIITCRLKIEALMVEPEPEPIAPEWTQANILKNLDLAW